MPDETPGPRRSATFHAVPAGARAAAVPSAGPIGPRTRGPDRPPEEAIPETEPLVPAPPTAPDALLPGGPPADTPADRALRVRLRALRELVALSRARLPEPALAEAGRLLAEAAERDRLTRLYTTVAIAGATGSGKSTLFNTLAGGGIAETGVRRPMTASPHSCAWEVERGGGPSPDALLDRLGVQQRRRRRAHRADPALRGLVLLDLPDHDSALLEHRREADRLLARADAVIWLLDPEKYADALLHDHYLRAFAGHAEVSLVVLNQIDRLPTEATEAVLDDVRRLLDERGVAVGEHGEPGAGVLAVSALTGQGMGELRRALAELVASREAPALRLAADADGTTRRLRPLCVAESGAAPLGLTEEARAAFEERLAAAVGAPAAGAAAERGWLRRAERICGTPWGQLVTALAERRAARRGEPVALTGRARGLREQPPVVSRPALEEAVRRLTEEVTADLPEPWAESVRRVARQGASEVPPALEGPPAARGNSGRRRVPWSGRQPGARASRVPGAPRPPRPVWWSAAAVGQGVFLTLHLLGLGWLALAALGRPVAGVALPAGLLVAGAMGAPLLAWACRLAAVGPARAWGRQEEERLRSAATAVGRARVLEPVAAELVRYREVREQWFIASGGEPLTPR
ncbi:GTPase [Streptomyces alkaliphilus]|uniref:GTPase n=1 Tax=Streptomyces alkaliphilus TaxID=1472722 RepID=UPI0015664C63